DRPQRHGPSPAGGRPGASRAWLQGRRQRLGCGPSYVASRRCGRRRGHDRHGVWGTAAQLHFSSVSRSLQEIVDALARAGALVEAPERGTPMPDITGLTADARRLEPGMLFCAVRGAVLDGHTFVADAVARGAPAVLVELRQPSSVAAA